MIKSIIKELFIIILLLIAIGLVFCIVFYDYNTMNITIPSRVQAYELSEETEEELSKELEGQEKQELVKTYIVDSNDLGAYISSGDYEVGKPNPFAKYTTPTDTEGTDGNNSSTENPSGEENTGDTGKFSTPGYK